MNRDRQGYFSLTSAGAACWWCHLQVAIAFCDNQARYDRRYGAETLFRYYSMHIAGNAGESAKSMAMRRSSAVGVRPFKPRDFILPRFSAFCWLVGALSV